MSRDCTTALQPGDRASLHLKKKKPGSFYIFDFSPFLVIEISCFVSQTFTLFAVIDEQRLFNVVKFINHYIINISVSHIY